VADSLLNEREIVTFLVQVHGAAVLEHMRVDDIRNFFAFCLCRVAVSMN
jgi:hypothetical protein